MKPKQISKDLKVPADQVYKVVGEFKKRVRQLIDANGKTSSTRPKKIPKSKCQELLACVSRYLDKVGIYDLKIRNLRNYLLD